MELIDIEPIYRTNANSECVTKQSNFLRFYSHAQKMDSSSVIELKILQELQNL